MSLKGCIFDLDGVITDTAKYHYESWKWVGEQVGYELTETKNKELKGVGRKESLECILQWSGASISDEVKQALLHKKNEKYLTHVATMTPNEAFKGFAKFNRWLKAKGIKVAVGSSSRNAILILEKLDFIQDFEAVVHGGMTAYSKPEPDIFLLAAERIGLAPEECVVIEDSQAGLLAAKKAGMLGVQFGEDKGLEHAHMHLHSWDGDNLEKLKALF